MYLTPDNFRQYLNTNTEITAHLLNDDDDRPIYLGIGAKVHMEVPDAMYLLNRDEYRRCDRDENTARLQIPQDALERILANRIYHIGNFKPATSQHGTTATDSVSQTAEVRGHHLTCLYNGKEFGFAVYSTMYDKIAVVISFEYTHDSIEYLPAGKKMMELLIEQDMINRTGQCDGTLWLDNANIWE